MGPNDPCDIDLTKLGRSRSIPSELHSDYDHHPFRTCSACSRNLADAYLYQVQKIVRGKETPFEMAICEGCAMGLCQECSVASLQALKGFFIANFRPSPESWHCHFCGFPRLLTKSHTIVGICQKDLLLTPAVVLCDRCGEKLQARMSEQTREAQDDFIRSTFPGVPADLDVLPSLGGLLLKGLPGRMVECGLGLLSREFLQ